MIIQSIVGLIVAAWVYETFLQPRLAQSRIRRLIDVDRVAALAGVAPQDIRFLVLGSYRVKYGDSGWIPHYRVGFSYMDLSTLVDRNRNPWVSIGDPVEFDAQSDGPRIEAMLAERLTAWLTRVR